MVAKSKKLQVPKIEIKKLKRTVQIPCGIRDTFSDELQTDN